MVCRRLKFLVLSWDTIVEALVEYDYEGSDRAAAHLPLYGFPSASDPELVKLRVSVVFLSLQMIADGVLIDSFALLKIKGHLANVIGFRDVASVPSQVGRLFQIQFGELSEINGFAFPCVNQLLKVMDAPHRIDIPPCVMANSGDLDEKPVPVLAGSATAVEATAKLVASQSQQYSQDALITQAKAFLDSSLTKYAQNGLFANLLKASK
ncbi:hypothetical protein C0993_009991 [Termitomyces sp. T159_Od127]|nr:hypothetical protein C0993_009991 [Termitomyces sp. T159_Od127]